jgi:hypothetical protein
MLRFAPECGPSMRVVRQRSLLRNSLGTMPWPSIRLEPEVSERRQAHLLGDARDVACAVAETSKLARDHLDACHSARPVGQLPMIRSITASLAAIRAARSASCFGVHRVVQDVSHICPPARFFRVFDIRVLDIKRLMRDWLIVTRRRRQSLHGRSRICQVDHRCRRRSPDVDPYGPCAGEAQSTEIGRM